MKPVVGLRRIAAAPSGRRHMETFFVWIGFSMFVAVAANAGGRSGTTWFFISIAISPLLALMFVLVMARRDEPERPSA